MQVQAPIGVQHDQRKARHAPSLGFSLQPALIEAAIEHKRCGMAVRLVVAGPQGACGRPNSIS